MHFPFVALISGVVSGFFGSGIGALTFMTAYTQLSDIVGRDERYKDMDFRAKNMMIYISVCGGSRQLWEIILERKQSQCWSKMQKHIGMLKSC